MLIENRPQKKSKWDYIDRAIGIITRKLFSRFSARHN